MDNRYDLIARSYDHYAVLQHEIADRLIDRLSFFKAKPSRILEIACATGFLTAKLSAMYPDAAITAIDSSDNMLAIAKEKNLPNVIFLKQDIFQSAFRAGQFDAIIFNCFPEDHADLPRLLERCYAWLAVGGFLMFSTFGVDTLKELRSAFVASGQQVHLKDYVDLHPIGDMLLHIGFFQPVMNAEWVTLTYRSLHGLWEDLKGTGSYAFDQDQLNAVAAAYDEMRVDDVYPATYEINYGMAEKRAEQPVKHGEVAIPISAIQGRK